MCKQPAAQAYQGNSFFVKASSVSAACRCWGTEVEGVVAAGAVEATVRTRVLPGSVCLALPALPRGAVPDPHDGMAVSLELPQGQGNNCTYQYFLTKALLHLHSVEQVLLTWCGSRASCRALCQAPWEPDVSGKGVSSKPFTEVCVRWRKFNFYFHAWETITKQSSFWCGMWWVLLWDTDVVHNLPFTPKFASCFKFKCGFLNSLFSYNLFPPV